MGKYLMLVQSRPKPGRDDEYNAWYDGEHYADICAIPGIKGGRRLESTPVGLGGEMLPYLALFEVETEDPASIVAELGKRAKSGVMRVSDALDASATALRFFALREQG